MPYGTIKVDTITFTDAGVDKSVAISGLVQNPTFTGNVTATGTISGLIVQAPTVTGTTANFASGVYTTQISGAIVKVPAGSAGAPSIQVGVGASVAPGLYGAGTDLLGISTGGAGRIFIDSTGQLGIGTSSPSQALEVAGNISFTANAASARIFGPPLSSDTTLVLRGGSSTGEGANIELGRDEIVYIDATQHLFRSLAGTERARIDNSGRLLVGTSSNRPSRIGTSSFNSLLQIESDTEAAQSITRWAADSNSSRLHLQKGRGTGASPTIVAADDNLGDFTFSGYDGANMTNGARITAAVDGTPGTNDMPGRLVFSTTADGAATPTERMRINSIGVATIGKTSTDINVQGILLAGYGTGAFARDGEIPLFVNRNTDDGGLVVFRQDGTDEGSISVSGTTVSYNGAHLSRWSQLPGGAERTEILRGTVLSNIDEMCGWGEEDNEQLNRMQVSDVEGDPNVSGVFQGWDDDDDTYTDDFYCAMTGDFIIRIAEGITVQRGDLLMSAGDGTAKPQGDDIVRSKTVAKVTSTHVTCTYDDNSYCVPCVLMAC